MGWDGNTFGCIHNCMVSGDTYLNKWMSTIEMINQTIQWTSYIHLKRTEQKGKRKISKQATEQKKKKKEKKKKKKEKKVKYDKETLKMRSIPRT